MPPKRLPPAAKRKFYRDRVPLPCPFCDREFRNLSGLTSHKNIRHPHAGSRFASNNVANTAPDSDLDSSSHASPTPNGDPTEDNSGSSDEELQPTHILHPHLNGQPCDSEGNFLAEDVPPLPYTDTSRNDWSPYGNRLEFEMADFLFTKSQSSSREIDFLMDAFTAFGYEFGTTPPFTDHADMYNVIDSTSLGDAPWSSFTAQYAGPLPDGSREVPLWMSTKYDVWCRDPHVVLQNILANPDFKDGIDYSPYREFASGKRRYTNLMSGNWAWRQADKIFAADPCTQGSMFLPIILGSDKTTVSVATGQNEYYPLYLSLGNVFNNVRRAHRNAVVVIGFLAIPKSERKEQKSKLFRKFRRQLFHSSVSAILQPLRPHMTTPVVLRCPDGHYRRVIYGLGPFIADYPEQVLASCIVQGWCPLCPRHRDHLDEVGNIGHRSRLHTEQLRQVYDLTTLWNEYGVAGDLIPFTDNFPRADIHELLSGDILHQVIKGTFKDHLVTWVGEYLILEHGESKGNELLDEIDRRIAAVPLFPGLRRFSQGRDFKQWTGDDSKALMKVYLPALVGIIPDEMVKALSTFMECCYIIRRSVHTDTTVQHLEENLQAFRQSRVIFETSGVRTKGISLPRQHSLDHYPRHIREFGAPNGLCSSITESKHIKAVKEPWRRSNRFHALGQMLLTNQRLDKLAAARSDFEARGMLQGSLLSSVIQLFELEQRSQDPHQDPPIGASAAENRTVTQENVSDQPEECPEDEPEAVEGPCVLSSVTLAQQRIRNLPRSLDLLSTHINIPNFSTAVKHFLYDQLHPNAPVQNDTVLPTSYYGDLNDPRLSRFSVFTSARATFYAPSDLSGIGGMYREHIRATKSWQKGLPRYDCVFVETDASKDGMRGLHVARVKLFFSFWRDDVYYPCAFVDWFTRIGEEPDELTGMWVVEPELNSTGQRESSVIHLDTIVRGAHLIGLYGSSPLPRLFQHSDSLDAFKAYYVNKYIDHHTHETVF